MQFCVHQMTREVADMCNIRNRGACCVWL